MPTKKPTATKSKAKSARKPAAKREVIEPHQGDKRYVRRKAGDEFSKTVNVGKSLSADSRTKAKTKVPKGQGDRGDTKR